jgi:hypothetical protein
MMLRVELWVEGPTDARTALPDGQDKERPPAEGGALVPLVRKVLGSADGMNQAALDQALPEREMVARRLQSCIRDKTKFNFGERRRKLSPKGGKVLTAIFRARRQSPDTLIVAVWDQDGEDAPLQDREAILDEFRSQGMIGATVGICVEEIEAWLLADPGAFRRTFGRGPPSGLSSSPEDEPDPKKKLDDVLEDYPDTEDRVAIFRKLAETIDLAMLERSCPRGFGAFRAALQEFICPLLRAPRS